MDTRPISVDQFQGRRVMFDQTKSYALLRGIFLKGRLMILFLPIELSYIQIFGSF